MTHTRPVIVWVTVKFGISTMSVALEKFTNLPFKIQKKSSIDPQILLLLLQLNAIPVTCTLLQANAVELVSSSGAIMVVLITTNCVAVIKNCNSS